MKMSLVWQKTKLSFLLQNAIKMNEMNKKTDYQVITFNRVVDMNVSP